jgi:acetyl esterase/lipase
LLFSSVGTSYASTAATPSPVAADCTATEFTPHLNLQYAETTSDPNLTSVDVYALDVPSTCAPSPIFIWIHGGGWRNGDKNFNNENKMEFALEQGWTFVSINYRLTPDVTYPVPNQDAADAIGWTLDHAAEFNADPTRVAIMGHSAGGGIAAALSTDERYLENAGHQISDIDCTVALDSEGYDVTINGGKVDLYDDMFGTDPAAWPDMSPINHIAANKGIPDFFIVTRGQESRVGHAQDFANALEAVGVLAQVIEVDLSHGGVNQAVGDPADTLVTPKLLPFLEGCFA